jgi:hypothetical protein
LSAVIYNGARATQFANAKFNEEAYEAYNQAVRQWQDNGGRRLVGGGVYAQTTDPPPAPRYLPTDFDQIYNDIASRMDSPTPYEDPYPSRPYYLGGWVFSDTKTS